SFDAAAQVDPSRHLRPANAAALTFMATLLDAERAMADHRLVAIAGTSLGWCTARGMAAALPFEDALRLMQEVALLREQAAADPSAGGQVIYPLAGPDWRGPPRPHGAPDDRLAHGRGSATPLF